MRSLTVSKTFISSSVAAVRLNFLCFREKWPQLPVILGAQCYVRTPRKLCLDCLGWIRLVIVFNLAWNADIGTVCASSSVTAGDLLFRSWTGQFPMQSIYYAGELLFIEFFRRL